MLKKLTKLTCIKTIMCEENNDICDFRQGELFTGEFTKRNGLISTDFSGELNYFEDGEWQKYFSINE